MEMRTLGTVATYINGRAFKPSEWDNEGMPIIRIQNLTSENAPYNYSKESFEEKYIVHNGDLLFAWSASLGAHIWRGQDAWLNQHIFKVIPNKEIDRDYLYYYLLTVIADLYAKTHGSGMVHITKAPFMNTPIPVPPLPEQERIVARIEELFSQLDAGVETLKKTKAQLLRYRRSVIINGLEDINNKYHYTYTTFGDICECLDSRREPVNKKTRAGCIGLYPYYGANGETGRIDDYIFDEELVLVCEDETFVGRIKPFSYIITGKSWVNNHAHILKGKAGIVNNKYLNYLLSYYPFLPIVTGTTGRKKLTQSALLNAPIKIVDFAYQEMIVKQIDTRLSVCDSIEQTVDDILQQAEAMRQSILKKAFEGGL